MDRIDRFFSEIKEVEPRPFIKTRVLEKMSRSTDRGSRFQINFDLLKPVAIALFMGMVNIGLFLSLDSDSSANNSELLQDFGIISENTDDYFLIE